MKGEVIGINAAKYSSTEVEGIGYAIPVSGVQDILDELMNRKTRSEVAEEKRGYLGIQGTTVDEDAAAALVCQRVFMYTRYWKTGLRLALNFVRKILSPSWMA